MPRKELKLRGVVDRDLTPAGGPPPAPPPRAPARPGGGAGGDGGGHGRPYGRAAGWELTGMPQARGGAGSGIRVHAPGTPQERLLTVQDPWGRLAGVQEVTQVAGYRVPPASIEAAARRG